MKLLSIFLFPLICFCQSKSYVELIKDIEISLNESDAEKEFIRVFSSTEFNQNWVFLDFGEFNDSLNFIKGVKFGNIDSALYLIKPIENEDYILGWYFYKRARRCEDLVIYKKGKHFYGSHLNLHYLNKENLMNYYKKDSMLLPLLESNKKDNFRRFYVVTRFHEKEKTFEHAIIYYDYDKDYYGIIRLFNPEIQDNKQTFQYNIEILPHNYSLKFLFKKTYHMERIELNVSNNFTIFANQIKFYEDISKLKTIHPKKLKINY